MFAIQDRALFRAFRRFPSCGKQEADYKHIDASCGKLVHSLLGILLFEVKMADFDGSMIWSEALERARGDIPEQEFLMWFRLSYVSFSEGTLSVRAPNSFLRDQFNRKYHGFMQNVVRELTDLELKLEVSSAAIRRGARLRRFSRRGFRPRCGRWLRVCPNDGGPPAPRAGVGAGRTADLCRFAAGFTAGAEPRRGRA